MTGLIDSAATLYLSLTAASTAATTLIKRNHGRLGLVFESSVIGGTVPKEFIPGVQKGLESSKDNGLLAGFPVIDFKATLYDGGYHDVGSGVPAFEVVARAAFRELREKASPKLLEPIMKVEVLTPDEYMDDVIGDLNSRRGQIQGTRPGATPRW